MSTRFIRKTNRLPYKQIYQGGYWYFVTICVKERKCIFGNVQNGRVVLSSFGKIIENKITSLSDFYDVYLGDFVIMPNHIHLIIGDNSKPLSTIIGGLKSFTFKEIKTHVEEGSCLPKNGDIMGQNGDREVMGNGDREVSSTQPCGQWDGDQGVLSTVKYLIQNYGSIWQKSFYDHVIRNEEDLQRIQEYIYNNPLQWELDMLHPMKDGFEK